ncbi:serine/threonine-protein kinase-like protein At3g51990 [Aristolochia californica]|uniref:serine/threonine-protein kinase-like protein At3g51990 n=1 Tax=Aristolochia californica TaxID=171875 RepID=UPI0035DD17C1
MGYLSCKAHSAIATCDSRTNAAASSPGQIPSREERKRKKKKKTKKNVVVDQNHGGDSAFASNNIEQFDYSDLEAATNGFSSQKLLGRGSHGSVYKGVLHNGRLVAVKKSSKPPSAAASASTFTPARVEVENEIEILSKIHSPRLVNLLGFTNGGDDRLLVVEFMKNGTLYDVLHSSPNPPGWGRRLRLALQTAKAIHTLHSSDPPVIHRDIKSANVLIDRNLNARLGDFGLALRCSHAAHFRSTPPAGTLGYLDPCYVTPDYLSTKTDVFSYGILLLEIISGRKAIDIAYSPPYILEWALPLIKKGKILALYDQRVSAPKDPVVRKQIPLLAAKCVRSCRDLRPSMKEVVDCLADLSKSSPLQLYNLLNINNPCIAVDDVGGPSKFVVRPMRSRSMRTKNLKDLMNDDEEEASNMGFRRSASSRRSSGRLKAPPSLAKISDGEDAVTLRF